MPLAEIREEMSPPVSEQPPLVHAEVLHNPRYATELHAFSGGTLLEIRHPSLGWMGWPEGNAPFNPGNFSRRGFHTDDIRYVSPEGDRKLHPQ